MSARAIVSLIMLYLPLSCLGETVSYDFEIDSLQVNFTGKTVTGLAINGQIPAPRIEAKVGDVLRATFHNKLNTITSVHWHGILLSEDQDGVPYLNTQPIPPGESFTFEFLIVQSGTYWYHSHNDIQIQRGVYGSLVLRDPDKPGRGLQEETLIMSDWTDNTPDRVLANLKKDDDYYSFKKNTVQSWDRVLKNGPVAISNRLNSSATRMGPMDLADVGYDVFLLNGAVQSTIALTSRGQDQVLLRLINGSTSSYFDVEYAGGAMTIIAADGLEVEPILVKRLRISTAETYDVLVPVAAGQSREFRATSFDGSGYASSFIGEGDKVYAPDIPEPNLFLMSHSDMEMEGNMGMDMGDEHDGNMSMPMPRENHSGQHQQAAHEGHEDLPSHTDHDTHTEHGRDGMGEVIEHMTDYRYLVSKKSTALPPAQNWREVELTLTGNMERYVWSFNGKTLREENQILIGERENVRFRISNTTMMHHPLHLHGHFFRVVNQHGERSPLKHTANVPPMGSLVIEFNADDEKDWLFHCHNQYHMKTGMNRVVSYQSSSLFDRAMAAAILPGDRWYSRTDVMASADYFDLDYSIAEDRNEFSLEVDSDFDNNHEAVAKYSYHFGRFMSAFAGAEDKKHDGESASKAIAGIQYTLPMLIGSEWRVDDEGDFRLELDSQLQFTRRIGFDWRWNTDEEYRYGLFYNISKRWSLNLNKDSVYGAGVGMSFLF